MDLFYTIKNLISYDGLNKAISNVKIVPFKLVLGSMQ